MLDIIKVFLKIGFFGFGGPAAHIGIMEDEIVTRRKWITKEKLLDLISITNLIPGPNSTEVVLHIGYIKGGFKGLIVAGLSFIIPAVLITLGFSFVYVEFGSLPNVQWFLLGIKPAVIAIITAALVKLFKGISQKRIAIVTAAVTMVLNLLGLNEILLLFVSGLIAIVWEYRKNIFTHFYKSVNVFLFPLILFFLNFFPSVHENKPALESIGLFFLKIGSVLYGSGYVLIAFLQGDIVDSYHWITSRQLLDAIAVGQFTPGPMLSTSTFIGYLIKGLPGAAVATICIFLPSFIFVLFLVRFVDKLRSKKIVGAALDGLNGGSLGLMGAVLIKLSVILFSGWQLWVIFIVGFVLLLKFKLNSVLVVISGIVLGFLFFYI